MPVFDLGAARVAWERVLAVRQRRVARGIDLGQGLVFGPFRDVPEVAFRGKSRWHFDDVRCHTTARVVWAGAGAPVGVWGGDVCKWCHDLWFASLEIYEWFGCWMQGRMEDLGEIFRLLRMDVPDEGTFFKSLPKELVSLPRDVSDDDVVALAHLFERVMYPLEYCAVGGVLFGDAQLRARVSELLGPAWREVAGRAEGLGRFGAEERAYARWLGLMHPFLGDVYCVRALQDLGGVSGLRAAEEGVLLNPKRDMELGSPGRRRSLVGTDQGLVRHHARTLFLMKFLAGRQEGLTHVALSEWEFDSLTPCAVQHSLRWGP